MIIWSIIKALKLPFLMLMLCGYTLISPTNVYFAIAFCLLMLPITIKHQFQWDQSATVLLFWGITYFGITSLYYTPNSWANEIVYLLGPLSFYICGKLFVSKLRNEKEIIWMIFIICFITSLPLYILTIQDVLKGELIAYSRRFEDSEVALAATLYGLVAAISLSGLGFFITSDDNCPRIVKWGFLILFACSLLTTIHLINRTGIVIALTSLIALMLTQSVKKIGKSIILLIIVSIVVLIYFGSDWLIDSVTAYTYRNDSGYGVDSGGGRFDRWTDALGKFLEYPMGWWQNKWTYNAQVHNLWLDIARVSGIIPFILMVMFFVRGLLTQMFLLKKSRTNPVITLIFGIVLSMCLAAAVEPVIEAKISYLCFIIFFIGAGNSIFINRKTVLNDSKE